MGLKLALKTVVHALVGPVLYDRIAMFRALGYWPSLKNPRSFNEKITHRKLFAPVPNAAMLADKYAVRAFVSERCGDAILPKLHGVYGSPAEVPLAALPGPCVIKANNGTGKVVFCDGPVADAAGQRAIRRQLDGLFDLGFSHFTHESWYRDIAPKIMVEERLGTEDGEIPSDYKFYVFHGTCRFVHVDRDRFKGLKRRIYDMQWKPMDYTKGAPLAEVEPMPPNFLAMVGIVEKLAQGMDFVRVDMYDLGNRVVFGEMTLTPASGLSRFHPKEIDFEWGKLW